MQDLDRQMNLLITHNKADVEHSVWLCSQISPKLELWCQKKTLQSDTKFKPHFGFTCFYHKKHIKMHSATICHLLERPQRGK